MLLRCFAREPRLCGRCADSAVWAACVAGSRAADSLAACARTGCEGAAAGSAAERNAHEERVDAVKAALRALCVDERPEVRTCSMHSLTSVLTAHGASLCESTWDYALFRTLLPLVSELGWGYEDQWLDLPTRTEKAAKMLEENALVLKIHTHLPSTHVPPPEQPLGQPTRSHEAPNELWTHAHVPLRQMPRPWQSDRQASSVHEAPP